MLKTQTSSGLLVTADKVRIAYTHSKSGHNAAVIITHGFFASKDAALIRKLRNYLLDKYDVIAFDLRGHGKSSGLFSWASKEHWDLQAVLDYAKKSYEKVAIIGFSLGAAISMRALAEKNSADTLIAVSAPYEFAKIDFQLWRLSPKNDIFDNLKEGMRGRGLRPGPFWLAKKQPLDLADKLICPVLYIHGDKDWVIRHTHSNKLYNRTTAKKKIAIIKNGPHAEYLLRENTGRETISLIRSWLEETL